MLRSFARALASSGILLSFPLFVQAQPSSVSVGTATAAPGQKSTGYLEVPSGVDAGTSIPVIVINGEKRGPVLALVSGAHGTEYTSIIALEKLISLLDPSQIAGTVNCAQVLTSAVACSIRALAEFPRRSWLKNLLAASVSDSRFSSMSPYTAGVGEHQHRGSLNVRSSSSQRERPDRSMSLFG